MKTKTKHAALEWLDDRWHLEGRGIHAGEQMELLCSKGEWLAVRIESSDHGRRLSAWIRVHGRDFVSGIDTEFDALRWP